VIPTEDTVLSFPPIKCYFGLQGKVRRGKNKKALTTTKKGFSSLD